MVTRYSHAPINSAPEFLAKLKRERQRFKRGGKHTADHIFNFYVTGWHITHWIWKEHIQGSALQSTVGPTLMLFQRWVRDTGKGPLMRCYIIATGGKHYERDQPGARDATEFDVSAQTKLTRSGTEWLFEFLDTNTRQEIEPSVPVTDDMEAVVQFWSDFLKQNNIR